MRGKRCSLSDAFMIWLTGNASSSAYSLDSQLGISSGPLAFVALGVFCVRVHHLSFHCLPQKFGSILIYNVFRVGWGKGTGVPNETAPQKSRSAGCFRAGWLKKNFKSELAGL